MAVTGTHQNSLQFFIEFDFDNHQYGEREREREIRKKKDTKFNKRVHKDIFNKVDEET